MRLHSLSLAAMLASKAYAGVKFTSPAAGASVAAGTITVEWEDDDTSPSVDDLSGYTLQLMVGGNEESNSVGVAYALAKDWRDAMWKRWIG